MFLFIILKETKALKSCAAGNCKQTQEAVNSRPAVVQIAATHQSCSNCLLADNSFSDNIIAFNCASGTSCYDGHAGNDYHMPADVPILAAADGYVVWSAFSPGADPCPGGIEPNGLLGLIILYHYNDYFTCYLHLNPPLNVAVGETVAAGDTIGFNGMTGCASSPHLHFEIRKENYFFDQELPWVVDPNGWWGNEDDPIISLRGFSSSWLWESDLLVDDGNTGFQRFYGPNWDYNDIGYDGDSWTVPISYDIENSAHYAIWVPEIPDSGEYNIDVYTPNITGATTHALYEIYIKDASGNNSRTIVSHDQTNNPNNFTKGTDKMIFNPFKIKVFKKPLILGIRMLN